MRIELAKLCSRKWYALGHQDGTGEAERRAAINRLYYAVFTMCRIRFGFKLTDGRGQHRAIPERMEKIADERGFSQNGLLFAEHFRDLKKLRGDSDYKFNKHIDEKRYQDAVRLSDLILAEIGHPRWDNAQRAENPPEDFVENFLNTLRGIREAFEVAAHRFHEAASYYDEQGDYGRLRMLFSAVKQPYFRFWYLTLDFVQSDAVEQGAAAHALEELQAASEVYFAVRDVFFDLVGQHYDPAGDRVLQADQVEMF